MNRRPLRTLNSSFNLTTCGLGIANRLLKDKEGPLFLFCFWFRFWILLSFAFARGPLPLSFPLPFLTPASVPADVMTATVKPAKMVHRQNLEEEEAEKKKN